MSKDFVDGVGAVSVGIEAGATSQPNQIVNLKRIAELYPIPSLYGTHLEYDLIGGEIWAMKKVTVGKGGKKYIRVPVFTPFGVLARLKDADKTEAYGLRVAMQDMEGRKRLVDVDRADLAKAGAAEVRGMLFSAGLRVMNYGEKIAIDCLKAAGPALEITIVRKPGWHQLDGVADPVFACPDGTILGLSDGHSLELALSACIGDTIARGGTLQGWKDATAAAIAEKGCPHWLIGVMAAFAGPIIGLAGSDTCGINFSGLSSSGKSLAQKLAASAWSKPAAAMGSLYQSAKATLNSLEQMASRSNNTILVLDELAHVSGNDVGQIIYLLSGNVGKRRMSAAATLKESYTWATFALFSAETALEEKVRKDGGAWTAGQTVRLPDVDVTEVDRQVCMATMAKIEGIKANYGHAGPAFVRALMNEGLHRAPDALRHEISDAARRIAALKGNNAAPDSAVVRAANVFAILHVAGILAKRYGLLPAGADVDRVISWAWDRFQSSSDAIVLNPEEQTIAKLREWIAERWDVVIFDVKADGRQDREAVGWYDENAVYIPVYRLTEAAGGTLKQAEIIKALKARGCLAKTKSCKHTFVSVVPKIGKLNAYALTRAEFGPGSDRMPSQIAIDQND